MSRVFKVKTLPKGTPTLEDFELVTEKLEELKDEQLLVQSTFISVDPYLRGSIRTLVGKPIVSNQVCKVLESKSKDIQAGDVVQGYFKWADKQVIDRKAVVQVKKQSEEKEEDKKISDSYYVGAYGMPGRTAYYGLIDVAELQKEKNVFISGAAGAVGSAAGQIAKRIYNCRVVGTAGSQEKIDWIKKECGYDEAFNYKNYKTSKEFQEDLKKAFPDGIDVYFDNTGGLVSAAVWDLLNRKARVIICGQISTYNLQEKPPIEDFLSKLIYKEIRIEGIAVANMKDVPRFYKDMKAWILDGRIVVKETVVEGFENTPKAFIGLFSGRNMGKMIVKC